MVHFSADSGLGSSGTAMYYAIEDYEEAKAYIENVVTNAQFKRDFRGTFATGIR